MVGLETALLPTRERIVETALRLFSERGTGASSMREVADAAGVTVPGLYYHFASKADLLRAVFAARGLEGVIGAPDDAALPSGLEDRLRTRALEQFDRLVAEAGFLRLIQRESTLGDADAKQVGDQLGDTWREGWRDVLVGARDLLPDVDVIAVCECITTFLWGLFVEYLGREDATIATRIPVFARLVAHSIARQA